MPKILCLSALALAVILLVLCILDLSMGFPFKGGSMALDIIFMIGALVISVLSWLTFREQ